MSGEAGEQHLALELDQRARREALDVRRSMLLQAPAGSGKTTVLSARYLALLAVVDSPEQILAITFTRKAAAEMRQRILHALQAASAGEGVAGIDAAVLQAAARRERELGWDLLRNPARLRIETIDALNHWLASQLPIAARSGPRLEIANAPLPLYRRAARRALENALQDSACAAAAELLFERLDNSWSRFEQLLLEMLQRRSHWLPRVLDARDSGLAARVQSSLASLLRAELAAALASLPPQLVRESEQILTLTLRLRARSAAHAALPPPDGVLLNSEPHSLPYWRALCDLALTDAGWRRRFTVREGLERDDAVMKQRLAAWIQTLAALPSAQHTLSELRLLPEAGLGEADNAALDALALVLVRAAAELQLVFAASGKVDYAYVAAAARAALSEQGEPSDFALRAGSALQHLLIDEFQDTSYEQFELLRLLTASWERGDGRTLFVVGDPMQSIYQFREAEVGLFLRARDFGVGEIAFEALSLRRNFRSRAPLIAWINQRFARLFPAQDDARMAAIRYLPSLPAKADDQGEAVRLHHFDAGDQAGEAARVVEIVRAARASDANASVAVLVASREHAAPIVAQLRVAQFALRGIDLERLRDREVIRDLAALTRALLHASDRAAWLALLRAPWCGLSLAELEGLLARAEGDLFASLRAAAGVDEDAADAAATLMRTRLARVCAALAPVLLGAECALPLWQRVEHSWLRLAGPAIYPQELDRLDAVRFLDALALHDEPETLVGEALGELTERLFCGSPPCAGAIEIMTIHAAKGLEWDVVILPGLGRRTALDVDPLLHWIELPRASAGTDLLLAPIRATQRELRASLPGYIKHLRRQRARLERVRLLYVAATRARAALHLLGSLPSVGVSAHQAAPQSGSLLEIFWPAIRDDWLALAQIPSAERAAPPLPLNRTALPLRRLPVPWRIAAPPPPLSPQRLQLTAAASEATEYSWVGMTARAVGTIVHAELQRLATATSVTAPAPAGALAYAAWLAELGVGLHEQARAGARIVEALERTLADERGRWLLSATHREARSEWRLSGMHEGRVLNVIVDRMLVDQQGQRWIIDFKTSTHEGGAPQEFIEREAQRYRMQLQRYAALAAQLGPEPIRVALYFPLLGVFRELELG